MAEDYLLRMMRRPSMEGVPVEIRAEVLDIIYAASVTKSEVSRMVRTREMWTRQQRRDFIADLARWSGKSFFTCARVVHAAIDELLTMERAKPDFAGRPLISKPEASRLSLETWDAMGTAARIRYILNRISAGGRT
jgi:hypothetical protein